MPALIGELRKLGYFAGLSAIALALVWFPITGVLAPGIWLLASAWMLAVEYTGYPMENHGLSPVEARRRLRHHRALALGFGMAVVAATLIPLINLAVMPAAVAGATVMWAERLAR